MEVGTASYEVEWVNPILVVGLGIDHEIMVLEIYDLQAFRAVEILDLDGTFSLSQI